MTHKTSHSHSHHHEAGHSHHHGAGQAHHHGTAKRAATFTKIFRWQQEQPGPMPVRVEVAGTFSNWQKLPLKYDRASGIWHLTVNDIPGNRTHNYMLLVNRRPTPDKNSDGMAVPHSDEEKQYQLATPRGPRVFMLFSQTK
jgi:1,4-alpha-glucan branching enzyme